MRPFNYSKIKEEKWNSEILGLIAAIQVRRETRTIS